MHYMIVRCKPIKGVGTYDYWNGYFWDRRVCAYVYRNKPYSLRKKLQGGEDCKDYKVQIVPENFTTFDVA